jgi:hypothetical protein
LSGKNGADANRYQELDVVKALQEIERKRGK